MKKNIIFFIMILTANSQEAMPPTVSTNPTPSPTLVITASPTASDPTIHPTVSNPTMYPTVLKPTMYPTASKPIQKKKKPTRNPNYVT